LWFEYYVAEYLILHCSVFSAVFVATREISERADNGGREEKETVRKTAIKKEGACSLVAQ